MRTSAKSNSIFNIFGNINWGRLKWVLLGSGVTIFFLIGIFFDFHLYDEEKVQKCIPHENNLDQPVIYNLKTELGVTYQGSHWFHMAENFMTQHSILREKKQQTCVSETYFNFNKGIN